mmetsp:Transcript_105713/g.340811  ORF Transcript_105713/g.340811 Transcript_105713/m.340811 type:complete len:241 (+) Transcript_105713:135-857(+)
MSVTGAALARKACPTDVLCKKVKSHTWSPSYRTSTAGLCPACEAHDLFARCRTLQLPLHSTVGNSPATFLSKMCISSSFFEEMSASSILVSTWPTSTPICSAMLPGCTFLTVIGSERWKSMPSGRCMNVKLTSCPLPPSSLKASWSCVRCPEVWLGGCGATSSLGGGGGGSSVSLFGATFSSSLKLSTISCLLCGVSTGGGVEELTCATVVMPVSSLLAQQAFPMAEAAEGDSPSTKALH